MLRKLFRWICNLITRLYRQWIRNLNRDSYYKSPHWLGLRAELIKPWSVCVDDGERTRPGDPLQLDHVIFMAGQRSPYYLPDGTLIYYNERKYPRCLQI